MAFCAAVGMSFYRHHVFCCTNQRPDGHSRGCCAAGRADKLRAYLKARVKEEGLPNARINMAGCLDRCELGPVLVIYPDATWYHYENEADLDEILEEHLRHGRVVSRLLLGDQQKTLP
jgi:(2Fe-2S) ferredoxin